jgi:hypothetical protein
MQYLSQACFYKERWELTGMASGSTYKNDFELIAIAAHTT